MCFLSGCLNTSFLDRACLRSEGDLAKESIMSERQKTGALQNHQVFLIRHGDRFLEPAAVANTVTSFISLINMKLVALMPSGKTLEKPSLWLGPWTFKCMHGTLGWRVLNLTQPLSSFCKRDDQRTVATQDRFVAFWRWRASVRVRTINAIKQTEKERTSACVCCARER